MSPASIAVLVLFGAMFVFLYKAYDARSDFRLHWETRRPASERQELAEVVRRTVGVTADQVADFRRWRTGAVAALILFIVMGSWMAVFGPSTTATIRPVNILGGAWIAAIITARFLWSTRTFGRIFYSAVVPDTLPATGIAPKPVRQRPTAELPPAYDPPVAVPALPVDRMDPETTARPRSLWTAFTRNPIVRFTVGTVVAAVIQVYVSRFL
jgi:hypothetical protein